MLSTAQDGANVIINYVNNVTEAEKVVAEIEKDGKGTAFPIKADITSTEGRKHLVDTTVNKYGKIDILCVLLRYSSFFLYL
jgi:3-oxoacyl-[acyl-carrier protein] reductase